MESSFAKLRIALVSVMDVLGYTDAISRTSTLAEGQAALSRFRELTAEALQALNEAAPTALNGVDEVEWRVRTYTDNYLLHTQLREHGEPDLAAAFRAIARFQCVLLRHQHLCRGGMSLGPAHIDDHMVFGRPVVEAHYLEQQVAEFPRIILAHNVSRLVARHLQYYGGRPYFSSEYYLLEDFDGQWFINYLSEGLIDNTPETGWLIDEDLFRTHRKVAQDGLQTHRDRDRVFKKYLWTASYHNWFVKTHRINEWYPHFIVDIPGAYEPPPPKPLTDARISHYLRSFRGRVRSTDEDYNDVVRIAARL